jgi:hypothetical protein
MFVNFDLQRFFLARDMCVLAASEREFALASPALT